jgi:long-chain acyl-CoA synthetase
MKYLNLGDMFFSKHKENPSGAAYRYKKDGNWISVSFEEAVRTAEKVAAGFASLGIKKGDRIALISGNRLEWALTDYATLSLGALLVPIYPSLLAEQIQYMINDSGANILVASDELQTGKIQKIIGSLKNVNNFFVMDTTGTLDEPWKSYAALQKLGEDYLRNDPDYVTKQIKTVSLTDWASIIYTSGTTGEPKGAILTHLNFLTNIEDVSAVVDLFPDDILLSFLPLSHVLERMAGHYLSCYHGCEVAYAESIDTVAQNLLEIKPTMMVSVPRLYEKIYARILDTVESGPGVKRKIFYWALKVGKEYVNRIIAKKSISPILKSQRNLAHKLVFSKLHEKVGGRMRFCVSGGAPLSPDIAEFFGGVGIKILEGYGLTETSPVIAVNLEHNFKFGTVGPVLPSVEVQIAEDGEILTRGNHVMVGYLNKPEETREVIDDEKWLHTGDIGFIDEDGMLKITDRKKNIIVTSGGKNIAPAPIENTLITSKYIEQALVIGDKRKYCTAILVPANDPLKSWAQENNLAEQDIPQLLDAAPVKQMLRQEIERLTPHLASYENVKDFIFAKNPFTIESGELTPSLKIKRKIVEQNYSKEIEAMYAGKDNY